MPDDNELEELEIPSFENGGRVRKTGIALVHEGEFIMPSPTSEAVIKPDEMLSQGVINYYFPVEVVLVGGLPEEERASLEACIWESLGDALERMT